MDINSERKLLTIALTPLLGGVILRKTDGINVAWAIGEVAAYISGIIAFFLVVGMMASSWILVLRIRVPDTTLVVCVVIIHIILISIVYWNSHEGRFNEIFTGLVVIFNLGLWAYLVWGIFQHSTTYVLSMGESHLFTHNDYSVYGKSIQVSAVEVDDGSFPGDKADNPVLYTFSSEPDTQPTPLNFSMSNPTGGWVDDFTMWNELGPLFPPVFWSAFNLNAGSTVTVKYSSDWDTTVSLYVSYVHRNYGVVYWDFKREIVHADVFGAGTEEFLAKDSGLYILSFVADYLLEKDHPLVEASFFISRTQFDTSTSDNSCELAVGQVCSVNTSKSFVITTPVVDPTSRTYWKVKVSHKPFILLYVGVIVFTFLTTRFIICVVESEQRIGIALVPHVMLFGPLLTEQDAAAAAQTPVAATIFQLLAQPDNQNQPLLPEGARGRLQRGAGARNPIIPNAVRRMIRDPVDLD